MARKASVKPVSARKGTKRNNPPPPPVEDTEPLTDYSPDVMIDGAPAWNKRLPWLMSVPLCGGYHDFKRDKVTSYVYCFTCGISCGLV